MTNPKKHRLSDALQHRMDNLVGHETQATGDDLLSAFSHELLAGIPEETLAPVLSRCQSLKLEKGDVLITPGEQNSDLYLLTSGLLKVYLDEPGSKSGFPINPGECVGEMSIIEQRPTSAWVVADSPCDILVMNEDVFWTGFMRIPAGVRNLLNLLTKRTRKSNAAYIVMLEEQLRLEHLEQELATAGKIQANILPQLDPLFPGYPQVDIAALIIPAKEVGGDFYDAFPIDNDRIFVGVGDVSGKGMPAALFMVRIMTSLRMTLQEGHPIEIAIDLVNKRLAASNEEMMFATVLLCEFNVHTGVLRIANGGHNAPFFSANGSPYDMITMPRGVLVGVHDRAQYGVSEINMAPGDTFIMYTDGVTEAVAQDQSMFKEYRAIDALNDLPRDANIQSLVDSLLHAVRDFAQDEPQSDDITIFGLRYNGDVTTN